MKITTRVSIVEFIVGNTVEFKTVTMNMIMNPTKCVFFISAQIFAKFDDFSMYIEPLNDDKFIQIIKIIKLGKNLGRNEKSNVGIPMLDIGIPT